MREMLQHIDSDELAAWMAYEQATGPLNDEWIAGALIAIHQQLQVHSQLLAAKVVKDVDDIPDVVLLPRPSEHYLDPDLRGAPIDADENEYDLGDDDEE